MAASAPALAGYLDDDEDLTPQQMQQLLKEAEQRLRAQLAPPPGPAHESSIIALSGLPSTGTLLRSVYNVC